MAKFTEASPPPKVLLLDAVSGGSVKTNFNYSACLAFYKSLGCHVEEANQYSIAASNQVFRDSWDLIVVPDIGNVSAEFPQLTTILGYFDKTDIPVYISNVMNVAGSGNARTFTGALTQGATSKVTATGLENWQGRKQGNLTFYSNPATTWGAGVTPHARDGSDNLCLMSNTNGSHDVLMQIGYSSVAATLAKPWLGAQWMIDQCSDSTRKAQLKANIKKRYILMRWDGLGNTDFNTSFANLQTAYATLVSYGIKEIWLAAMWGSASSADLPDDNYPSVVSWFADRAESVAGDGSIFRVMNHETDIVNGAGTYDTFAEACTSDNVSADQFRSASYCYKLHCDQLTAAGFVVGTDGYGKGYPCVQDGNDMNNPSAHFLADADGIYDTDGFYGGFGAHLWVSGDEDYPTGVTPQASIRGSITWAEGRTLLAYSQDGIDDTSATELPTLWNADIVRCAINGGGIYYHGGASNFFLHEHADEFGQLFTSCPDVLASGPWEDMLESLKITPSTWFDV